VGGALGAQAAAPPAAAAATTDNLSVEAPWTAHVRKSDPGELQLDVSKDKGSSLGMSLKLAELEGLTAADLQGSGKPVTFTLRREAGTIAFTGRFANGSGQGTLRYEGDPAYWARINAMGVRNDLLDRSVNLLALPLLDVRSDYIAALRREGAIAPLSDYVGMRAVGVAPDMVREVRPLIAGGLKAHDLMAFAALGVTSDYARQMRTVFESVDASELTSMKALGVTADYVATMRAAGARIRTAGDAQSFRALGISPAAVRRAIEHGKANPSASDVMEMSMRF
jgi:hypothetical protein